jgi:hypothetical protein
MQQGRFGIGPWGMSADRLVKLTGDQKTLIGPGTAPPGTSEQSEDLAEGWAQMVGSPGRAKHGGATRAVEDLG